MDNIINEYAATINEIYRSVIQNYENSLNEIKYLEDSLSDINHEIEFANPKDMYHGYLMYKSIKELREKRRQAKERVEILKDMYEFLTGQQAQSFKNKIGQIKGDSKKIVEMQERRTYKPKNITNLTIENKHGSNHKSFEDMMKEFNETKISIKGGKLRK